jgi:hypothetical protein
MQDIVDAVCAALAAKYSGVPIEIKNRGEGFKRPSFFVEFIVETQTDMNRTTFESDPSIQITYFAPEDDYSNTDVSDQYAKYEEIKGLFSASSSLQVGSNFFYIESLSGGPRQNEIYITINLKRYGSRPQPAPAEAATTLELTLGGV